MAHCFLCCDHRAADVSEARDVKCGCVAARPEGAAACARARAATHVRLQSRDLHARRGVSHLRSIPQRPRMLAALAHARSRPSICRPLHRLDRLHPLHPLQVGRMMPAVGCVLSTSGAIAGLSHSAKPPVPVVFSAQGPRTPRLTQCHAIGAAQCPVLPHGLALCVHIHIHRRDPRP